MSILNEFKLSNHAIKRLLERDRNFAAMIPANCPERILRGKAYDYFKQSVEEKSVLNDTKFIMYIQERYGYDPIKFFINGKTIFVGYVKPDVNIIVTTILIGEKNSSRSLQVKKNKYVKRC
jgi:hypothetical protein